MGQCKHVIAALRRATHNRRVENCEVNGLFIIMDSGQPRCIKADGKPILLCFISYEQALSLPRSETSAIMPLDANALDKGFDGISLVVGKYAINMWGQDYAN